MGTSLKETHLYRILFHAFRRGGCRVLFFPHTGRKVHPRRYSLILPDRNETAWVYAWRLGRTLSDDPWTECRPYAQKGIFPTFAANPDGPTIFVGYDLDMDVFAGFDVRMLAEGRATDAVVTKALLRQALERELALGVRIGGHFVHPAEARSLDGEKDVVVAFRPELLFRYALSSRDWFEAVKEPDTLTLMYRASTSTIRDEEISALPAQRQRVARAFYQYVRDSTFARRVLAAYRNACAVTGLQLDLPVAAHILPVATGVANDEISNGIALSPNFHEAFDDGLIYFAYQDDGRLFLRKGLRYDDIKWRKRTNKEELVMAFVDKEIPEKHLPSDRKDWPSKDAIEAGKKYRAVFPSS